MSYEVEELVTINKRSNYEIKPVVALPLKNDKYYIFATKEEVSANDYDFVSRIFVDPITIIKNEHKVYESKEVYNLGPLSEEEVAMVQKVLSDKMEDNGENFDCNKMYVFQSLIGDKQKHLCYEFKKEQFYDILEDKLVENDEFKFVGRLDMLAFRFGRLHSGLFYLDNKDVEILQGRINGQKNLAQNKNFGDTDK